MVKYNFLLRFPDVEKYFVNEVPLDDDTFSRKYTHYFLQQKYSTLLGN